MLSVESSATGCPTQAKFHTDNRNFRKKILFSPCLSLPISLQGSSTLLCCTRSALRTKRDYFHGFYDNFQWGANCGLIVMPKLQMKLAYSHCTVTQARTDREDCLWLQTSQQLPCQKAELLKYRKQQVLACLNFQETYHLSVTAGPQLVT